MTTEEIFNKLATHMWEGVCYHNQLSQIYDFLGLYGYAHCHRHHSHEEYNGFHRFIHYYSTHYHKLLTLAPEAPTIIPQTWYKYMTKDVDAATRKGAIKECAQKWVEWETSTKKLY